MFSSFKSKIIYSIPVLFSLLSAVSGLIFPNIYNNVFPENYLPGAILQDTLTIVICILLFLFIYLKKEINYKSIIIITGLIGSLWYLYGIYTIERIYNISYLFYAASFASSFWVLIYFSAKIPFRQIEVKLKSSLRFLTGISSIIISVLFTILWITALIPLMISNKRIDFMYSIYILDLCFIMPAFCIIGILTIKNNKTGIFFSPSILILGFFVIFPLALNEIAKMFYGLFADIGAILVPIVFSVYMLILAMLDIRNLNVKNI